MAWTVLFIALFGIASLIAAVWSIVGLARGDMRFWPGVVGTGWAVLLLVITFIGIGVNWGGCPTTFERDSGTLRCAAGNVYSGCNPDPWALECGRPPAGCPAIAANAFCPRDQRPVFVFCEPIQRGGVKQPWATWSDLSFVAAGLWLLWFFHFFGTPGESRSGATTVRFTADNPMITIGWLSVAYGLIVIFMGPPSMWFHASMHDLGGWFDSISVVAWLMFNAVYVVYTLAFAMWDRGRGAARTITVLCAWGALVIVFGIVAALEPGARLYGYIVSGVIWGLAEAIYVFVALGSGVKYRRTWWLFVINFIWLAGTMLLWAFFNDSIPLFTSATDCQNRQTIPGHAFFHIMASVSTIVTFASFASEESVPA